MFNHNDSSNTMFSKRAIQKQLVLLLLIQCFLNIPTALPWLLYCGGLTIRNHRISGSPRQILMISSVASTSPTAPRNWEISPQLNNSLKLKPCAEIRWCISSATPPSNITSPPSSHCLYLRNNVLKWWEEFSSAKCRRMRTRAADCIWHGKAFSLTPHGTWGWILATENLVHFAARREPAIRLAGLSNSENIKPRRLWTCVPAGFCRVRKRHDE